MSNNAIGRYGRSQQHEAALRTANEAQPIEPFRFVESGWRRAQQCARKQHRMSRTCTKLSERCTHYDRAASISNT